MNPINLNGGGEIDARRTTGRLVEPDKVNDAQTVPTTNAPTAPLQADSVKVSERASAIGELTAKASDLPDIRQDRVAELRARVESGDYQPSADDIAAALAREAQASSQTS